MLQEAKRTIGYICPSCRQAVIVERSVFQLAASRSNIECPCKESWLQVELSGEQVRLTTPCIFCEAKHTVSCSANAFLHKKTIAFSCAASGMDCCYVGEESAVFSAIRRLEETVDCLEKEATHSGIFLNDFVMEETLAEIRDIGIKGRIFCTCGSRDWEIKVNYSSVELSCSHCKGVLKIPAATASDLDDLCSKMSLKIHRKES